MSPEMIPWMSEYEIADLPDYEKISNILARCGEKVANRGLCLTFHPGPFNVLQVIQVRFAKNYINLPSNTRKRLTVENDDKLNMLILMLM
jgi:UV DNA damage repair endonuclease